MSMERSDNVPRYGNFSATFRPHFQTATLWAACSDIFTQSQLAARRVGSEKFTESHKSIATISHNPGLHVLGLVGWGNISKKLAFKGAGGAGNEDSLFLILSERMRRKKSSWLRLIMIPWMVADCVTLHTPRNKHTQYLIHSRALSLMKPETRIVNTARASIVNEDALVRALESKHISAAALDVHYHEPQVWPTLASMENATLTTHIGGGVLETRTNFEWNAMRNIIAVVGADGDFAGDPLTPVNREAFAAQG
ncbi:uncharacterized protein N7477_004927 [Penicillium maclennaniae]|uniref:uncharacterized protein n=1 Tax=Penicillium maclennaniae TaxID=1343394 RepID=UPI00253F6779|nr:uncharacterized protein N7477_004927 [Penicillium maclennaniae]KAJ5674993.1 hypothetical protein N7477_004927 [Penicillium maclennaniae]